MPPCPLRAAGVAFKEQGGGGSISPLWHMQSTLPATSYMKLSPPGLLSPATTAPHGLWGLALKSCFGGKLPLQHLRAPARLFPIQEISAALKAKPCHQPSPSQHRPAQLGPQALLTTAPILPALYLPASSTNQTLSTCTGTDCRCWRDWDSLQAAGRETSMLEKPVG